MNNNSGGLTCVIGCWLIAALGGVLVAAMLMMLASFSLVAACFFGALALVIGGSMLTWAFCKGLPGPNEVEIKPDTSRFPDDIKPSVISGTRGREAAHDSASSLVAAGVVSASPEPAKAEEKQAPATVKADQKPAEDNDQAPTQASRARVPASPTRPPEPEPAAVKPSKKLSGQDELAERKGEWKYEGSADKPQTTEPKAPKAKAAKPAAKADAGDASDGSKPNLLSSAREGGPDDLKEIKGVGVQMEKMLHEMGIYHFDQIANLSPSEVQWVDANLPRFKGRVTRDNWVEQSKILAEGGETEFSKKVQKGGVYDE